MNKPVWGAATSSHQVEGGNQWNDWWAWEQSGKLKHSSGRACDQYRLFRQDFQLARSLGHTGHRFSLEWSRLEPTEGGWNEEAFRHYDAVFDALEEFNLEPVVTLHHFTNPVWFADRGGWLRKDAHEKFAAYAEKAAKRYGKRAKIWITLNEPLIFLYFGFLEGTWPPGERSLRKSFRALSQLLKAHIRAYQILHEQAGSSECRVSIAHHMTATAPCRPESRLDRFSAALRAGFLGKQIFKSLLSGFAFYPGLLMEKLPAAKTLDFLGVNYYTRDFVRFRGLWGPGRYGVVCPKDHHKGQVEGWNDLGWEIYPDGLYEVLRSLKSFNLPVIITENGICTAQDSLRQKFIRDHLKAVERAKSEGIEIEGYFYWSLVDNFEWAQGFRPRFGIVEVDYETQKRHVRPSAQTLRKSCEKIFGSASLKRGEQ